MPFWADQQVLTWVDDLLWIYTIEATELIHRGAIFLGDPVEGIPGADLMVAAFGQGKLFPLAGWWGLGPHGKCAHCFLQAVNFFGQCVQSLGQLPSGSIIFCKISLELFLLPVEKDDSILHPLKPCSRLFELIESGLNR